MIIDWQQMAPVVAFGDSVQNFNAGAGGAGVDPPVVATARRIRRASFWRRAKRRR